MLAELAGSFLRLLDFEDLAAKVACAAGFAGDIEHLMSRRETVRIESAYSLRCGAGCKQRLSGGPMAKMTEERIRIVSICGSLRDHSVNAAVLRAAARHAGPAAEAQLFRGLGDLPHFNPDHDREPAPPPVQSLRDALKRASAVLFSTPEYAGSLPGSFKNLLDWTIGSNSLYRLPVGWINPSAHGGARDAFCALRLVLERAGANIVETACAEIPVRRDDIDADGEITDKVLQRKIAAVVTALATAAKPAEMDEKKHGA
jgi:NAD(P)H-dependent FMN reductase